MWVKWFLVALLVWNIFISIHRAGKGEHMIESKPGVEAGAILIDAIIIGCILFYL